MATIVVMALSWLAVPSASAATERPGSRLPDTDSSSDSLIVSLITCYPGPDIYALCGHEAIRVRSSRMDSVWNYGIFNFNEPNFIYRFVKGETDYMVAGYPFVWFLPEYIERGSKVVEQELNLSQQEARTLLANLRTEALPENRRYRYNYVLDNCATRIIRQTDMAAQERVIYPDSIKYGSFRNAMRAYHKNYPWYQFGIDLALGSGIDRQIRARDEMFVPVEMMEKSAGAHFADGRDFVKKTIILNEGVADATLPPTPWYLSPLFVCSAFFILTVLLSVWQAKKGRVFKWLYSAWFSILGTVGLLSVFLVFVSEHEATSPNVLTLWINPLQYIFALCVLWRKTRYAALTMAWYNIVVIGCLLLIWPFQNQSANPAFFPLMGATVVMSALYAIIFNKRSYNNNARTSKNGATTASRRGGRKRKR